MLEPQRLLVVDDEEAICEGCRRIFTRQGFAVEKSSDAQAGLNMAQENDYAAVLLDIKMPTMTGIEFLEQLRTRKPDIPVILMTGYPSVPNAISAIRLGAAGYVTKPFTPEEISQAVQKHLRGNDVPPAAAASEAPAGDNWTPAAEGLYFWRGSWFQPGGDGTARVGALVPKSQCDAGAAVQLPGVGEVVYQGLPLAAVKREGQTPRVIAAPISGIVVAVNSQLGKPGAAAKGLTPSDWIAMISPTRLDEETKCCTRRRVVLLTSRPADVKEDQESLTALGCQVRVVDGWTELTAQLGEDRSTVVLVDADRLNGEGPKLVGRLNVALSDVKVVVMARADSPLETAYRATKIFYYAVDPFADGEIVDILQSAFETAGQCCCGKKDPPKVAAAPIATLNAVNRNGTKIRLMPAPDLLHRDEGLGWILRQKLLARLLPIETVLGESPITPAEIMKVAAGCDRVVVLVARDIGRLPGALVRDTKSEFISVADEAAGSVTTLVVQPHSSEAGLRGISRHELEALAEHIVNDMAAY